LIGANSTGVLVTDARRGPVLPVASGSAVKLSAADEGAVGENVEDAKYELGKDEKETAGSASAETEFDGEGAGPVTISD
jgi:hypothetical protein